MIRSERIRRDEMGGRSIIVRTTLGTGRNLDASFRAKALYRLNGVAEKWGGGYIGSPNGRRGPDGEEGAQMVEQYLRWGRTRHRA